MNTEKTLVILDPALKKGFTSVPNIILFANNLSMPAKCLYAVLLSFAWSENECFPGQERLAEVAGCTDRTIRKYLDELREYGLIYWVQRGLNQTNVYYINELSKVERLKALGDKDRKELSGPDRKGCTSQERKELSDKDFKRSVVVVDSRNENNSNRENNINNETTSNTVENDSAVFDLPASSETEICGQEMQVDKEEKLEERLAWEEFRAKVLAVAGADVSVGFAQEVCKSYAPEKITSAIKELERQLRQGVEIRGVGAWLRYALNNNIQPDQPATKTRIKPKNNSTRPPKSRQLTEQEKREKEFIRGLYLKTPPPSDHDTAEKKEKKREFIRSLYA